MCSVPSVSLPTCETSLARVPHMAALPVLGAWGHGAQEVPAQVQAGQRGQRRAEGQSQHPAGAQLSTGGPRGPRHFWAVSGDAQVVQPSP